MIRRETDTQQETRSVFVIGTSMNEKLDNLLEQMRVLEKEIVTELKRRESQFLYEVKKREVRFTEEARLQHRKLIKRFSRYLQESRLMAVLTAPIIWACVIPIFALDLTMMFYQAVCFPVYGIPKVKRRDYVILDRQRLGYLNWAEKLNCYYCGYANGVLACITEIAARTEQHWCPIKHALRTKSVHSRYRTFFDYGDAEGYRARFETVRRSFEDLEPDNSNAQD